MSNVVVTEETGTKFNGSATRGMSAKQIALHLGLPENRKSWAYGFVKVLETAGLVKIVGTRPPEGGKGKPEILYSFSADSGKASALVEKIHAADAADAKKPKKMALKDEVAFLREQVAQLMAKAA